MKEIFGVIALALSIGANIPYVIEIIRGQAQPQRISWLIWTMLGSVYFLSTIFDTGATLYTIGELVGPVTIFLLSLRYGVGGKNFYDLGGLVISGVAFGLLFVLDGVLVSLLLALSIDFVAILITIRKLRNDTDSESRAFWAIGAVSSIFAVLSLEKYVFVALAFPIYVLVVSSYIFIIAKDNERKPVINQPF